METVRNSTLVFLIKSPQTAAAEVCLAMKKRGFGVNRWNGAGGKVEAGETIIEAATRETREEISVRVGELRKVAELSFYFPANPAWNQLVHVYFCENWVGEPTESEEMRPKWFKVADIPFGEMWPDDEFWIPQVLAGDLIRGSFTFGEQDSVLDKDVEIVESL